MEYSKLKIVSLSAQNVMRLRAVSINPQDNTIIIGGNNGEGKTSVLESIVMALGGSKVVPDEPVRRGQKAALIVADLGDIIITRAFKEDGESSLEVKSKDGARLSSPQKLLDSLVGRICFDPVEFLNLDNQKQLAALREIVGLDFTEIDTERANAYGKRTDLKRDEERLKGKLSSMPIPSDTLPGKELDVAELAQKVAEAERIDDDLNTLETKGQETVALVNGTKKQIEAAQIKLKQLEDSAASLRAQYQAKKEQAKTVNVTKLQEQLANVQETNRAIQSKAQRSEVERELELVSAQIGGCTARIAEADAKKERLLSSAEFPVAGLSFDDTGLLFNNIPFKQASAAQKLRTSIAMGIALNPKIRVMIIRDGSLLDEHNLQVIKEMADASEMQVWIERVGEGEECSVIIEDGAISEDRAKKSAVEKPAAKTSSERKPVTGPRMKK